MSSGRNPRNTIRLRQGGRISSRSGFTLIEVVAALAILVLFLVPILGGVTRGLQSVDSAGKRARALELAQDKMTEIEMLPLPDFEGVEDGDFGKDYPGYRWEVETVKSPDIQLMEMYLDQLKGMEVHLRVYWEEGGMEKHIQISTILME